MPIALSPDFYWKERANDADDFQISSHRNVHTFYFKDKAIAGVEPMGRGLIVRFYLPVLEAPTRPVAVPTVKKGKAMIRNWVRPRQAQVASAYRYLEMRRDAA